MSYAYSNVIQYEDDIPLNIRSHISGDQTSEPESQQVFRSGYSDSDQMLYAADSSGANQSSPYSRQDFVSEILQNGSAVYTSRFSDVLNAPRARRPRMRSDGVLDYSSQPCKVEEPEILSPLKPACLYEPNQCELSEHSSLSSSSIFRSDTVTDQNMCSSPHGNVLPSSCDPSLMYDFDHIGIIEEDSGLHETMN